MKQKQIQSIAAALTAATKASVGAEQLAPDIGLVRNLAEVIDGDRTALVEAGKAVATATKELRDRRKALKAVVNVSFAYAVATRDALVPTLGRSHSTNWQETGFTDSLRV